MAELSDAENLLEIMLVTRAKQEKPVIQIDPPDCGCTECITGEYVPLNYASDDQILQMVMGKISNATSMSWAQIEEWYFERKKRGGR